MHLCPLERTLKDLVEDASDPERVRKQEQQHAIDMHNIAKVMTGVEDKVWRPVEVQRIIACGAYMQAKGLLEWCPKLHSIEDLGVAVRSSRY